MIGDGRRIFNKKNIFLGKGLHEKKKSLLLNYPCVPGT